MHLQEHDGVFSHQNDSNLFIGFEREPDEAMLASMHAILERHGAACGRLFVDVRRLSSVGAETVSGIRRTLAQSPVPARNVFFKGEQGFSIARDGNKVIVYRKPERDGRTGSGRRSLAYKMHHDDKGHGRSQCHCDGKGGCGGKGCCGHCRHGHSHGHEHGEMTA